MASTSQNPRPSNFHLLPKIYKPGNQGRHTVSRIGIILEGVSSYTDSILFPYAIGAVSYLKDTTDFLEKVGSTGKLLATLATRDVTSLYTNISHDD